LKTFCKIRSITPINRECIETGNGDIYERAAPDLWYKYYGESLESYYFCEEIEAIYQEYKRTH
jgi:hypothetical protein